MWRCGGTISTWRHGPLFYAAALSWPLRALSVTSWWNNISPHRKGGVGWEGVSRRVQMKAVWGEHDPAVVCLSSPAWASVQVSGARSEPTPRARKTASAHLPIKRPSKSRTWTQKCSRSQYRTLMNCCNLAICARGFVLSSTERNGRLLHLALLLLDLWFISNSSGGDGGGGGGSSNVSSLGPLIPAR